ASGIRRFPGKREQRMTSNRFAVALVAVSLALGVEAWGAPVPTPVAAGSMLLPDLVLEGPQYGTDPWLMTVSYVVRNAGLKDSTKATILRSLCVTDPGSGPRCAYGTGWNVGVSDMMPTFETPVPPLHKGEAVTLTAFVINVFGK